jgi:hypothetical protein
MGQGSETCVTCHPKRDYAALESKNNPMLFLVSSAVLSIIASKTTYSCNRNGTTKGKEQLNLPCTSNAQYYWAFR